MITAQLASIPDREEMMIKTVRSLLPQVDSVRVVLNNYKRTPKYPGVQFVPRNNEKGDAEKFFNIPDGYALICDDDLIYPENYVRTMIAKLQEYKNAVIVTCHGRTYGKKPVKSFYHSRLESYHCLKDVTNEIRVPVGGTGVMAFHSDYFKPDYNRIQSANMADIWISKFAKEQGVPIIVIPHSADWLGYQSPEETIYKKNHYRDEEQTRLFNSF